MEEKLFKILEAIYKNPLNTQTIGEGLFVSKLKEISIDVINGKRYYSIENCPNIKEMKAISIRNQKTEENFYIPLRMLKNVSFEGNKKLNIELDDETNLSIVFSFETIIEEM